MSELCVERPQGHGRLALALRLVSEQDYVNASFIFSTLGMEALTPAQLVRAGEAHFRAGHATRARVCFRDAVRAFRRAQKATATPDADLQCWIARAYGYLALYSWVPQRIWYAHRSRQYVMRSLAINPQHAFAYYVLALWHQRMPFWIGGRSEMTRGYLDRAIDYEGDRITFRMARARWHMARGEQGAAHGDLCVVASLPLRDPDDERRKVEALDHLAKTMEQRQIAI